jgi:hypothetical protein
MIAPGDSEGAKIVVYLDYGLDSYFGDCADLMLDDRGFVLRSRWRFPEGMQLAVRICAHPTRAGEVPICEDVTGIVVSCERMRDQRSSFRVTILFLDITEPTQDELSRVAERLELAI